MYTQQTHTHERTNLDVTLEVCLAFALVAVAVALVFVVCFLLGLRKLVVLEQHCVDEDISMRDEEKQNGQIA